MKSRWKWISPLEPDHDYVVLASNIPPRSRRTTWRLFRSAAAVGKQLETTPGVVGYSMLARPLRKQYATLSMWTGEAALAEFASAEPHREFMRELAPKMASTKFVRWKMRSTDGPPSWSDALSRLS